MKIKLEQFNSAKFFLSSLPKSKNHAVNYKSVLADELKSEKSFSAMLDGTLNKYFGQSATFYHVMDATGIKSEIWAHNDFPTEKFLRDNVDDSVFTWKPSRINPSQLDSDVQSKLTATLGKHAVIIPPELDEKLKTDSELREKVIANLDKTFKFHTTPPAFKMPGVKEYGTKIYGSVTILNAQGEVENCRITSGGTIMGPDEETLRQIEIERKKKLQRKEFNAELIEQARIEYLMTKDTALANLLKV